MSTLDNLAIDYEKQREINIEKNQQMLQDLGLLNPSVAGMSMFNNLPKRKPNADVPLVRKPSKPTPAEPARKSARLRGETVKLPADFGSSDPDAPKISNDNEDEEEESASNSPGLLSAEKFFSPEQVAKAIKVDSHFNGWVSPEVQKKYGIEASAAEAWEANGGGKFSFKDPLGLGDGNAKKKRRISGVPAGWSEAKYIAQKMFHKNPNSYFYRHTAPGVEHYEGDWTEPEKEKFLEIARQFGSGDKWGLFASYIPHRVGYQCSAFYRNVILPECLIIDPQYYFTSSGTAVYVGRKGARERERE